LASFQRMVAPVSIRRYIYRLMTNDFPQWMPVLAPMGARSVKETLKPLRQATLSQIETRLEPILPAGCLDNHADKDHSRDRLLPLNRTFWCWLWQILQCNTSCREVMKQLAMLFALRGRSLDENTSAYCQSRKLILPGLLQRIYLHVAQKAFSLAPHSTPLRGRRLKALDGSSVRLADTPQNRAAFPQPQSQKPGAGFPVMKIAALFCVATGAILGHATGSLWMSEISLAAQLISSLSAGDVLIVDRGFCNYALAALLGANKVDVVARVPTTVRHIDFRQGKRLGSKDALFVWKKSKRPCRWMALDQWLGLPDTLTVRILRVRIHCPGSRVKTLTLMTTLLDPVLYPAREIAQAYGLRWREEMCFDDLKTTLHMAHIKCLSPQMVKKELCMFLIAHNLLRCLMAQAAAQARIKIEQISFKGTLDGFRQCSVAMTQAKSKAMRVALWEEFIAGLAADVLPERPGRIEPRAVKRIIKYPKLTTYRSLYKDRMSRNERRRQATKRKNALI
jgi:Transposase DDE domain